MAKAKSDPVEEPALKEAPRLPIQVGFGDPPGRTFVFVGADDDNDPFCWYKLNFTDGKKIPIYDAALTGYIADVRVTPKKWKDTWGYKVDITVLADKEYVIRSGVQTAFSKGLVHNLTLVEDFSKPLAICAVKGDEAKVVWGNLVDVETRKAYIFEGDRGDKLLPLVIQLQEKLGVQVQTKESIAEFIQKWEEEHAAPRN